MRDHVLLYINGTRHEIRGRSVFLSLTDFLREHMHLCGTKVVCAEGDCGACTVLVGRPHAGGLRYLTVDACIQFLYQLDCRHVVTVEGLTRTAEALHPLQQALVDHHGSQCGYCTPGFVMALAGMYERQNGASFDDATLRTALTGNLCRCTGYVQIMESARAAASVPSLEERYASAEIAGDLERHSTTPVAITPLSPALQGEGRGFDASDEFGNQSPPAEPLTPDPSPRSTGERGEHVFFAPVTLEAALDFKSRHPEACIISGGTELGVLRNKAGLEPPMLLSLLNVPGLAEITRSDGEIRIGANVTWTQIEEFARDAFPEFHRLIVRFGSPQIRNVATLVGNVAHGSPIADSLPLLYVMDAEIDIAGRAGSRTAKINGFYKGYKVKDLAADVIITHVRMGLPGPDELLKLYKVSRRNDLDIATFGAAIRVRHVGNLITRAAIAYSGVGPTVVRLPVVESYMQGQTMSEAVFREAGRLARTEIQPITDVRGSRDFRLQLAENILIKFYFDCIDSPSAECSAERDGRSAS